MGHWIKEGSSWEWSETGDAPPGGEWGYSYDALTSPYATPPRYQPLPDAPADVEIPAFSFQDSWISNLNGILPPSEVPPSTPEGDHPPPDNPPFRILLSTIRDAEAWIKIPLQDAIEGPDGWEELRAYINRVKHWIFYRPEHVGGTGQMEHSYPTPATRHAPPSQEALEAVSGLDNLMLAGGQTLMTVGAFLDLLDTAGQIYVKADQNSFFPAS